MLNKEDIKKIQEIVDEYNTAIAQEYIKMSETGENIYTKREEYYEEYCEEYPYYAYIYFAIEYNEDTKKAYPKIGFSPSSEGFISGYLNNIQKIENGDFEYIYDEYVKYIQSFEEEKSLIKKVKDVVSQYNNALAEKYVNEEIEKLFIYIGNSKGVPNIIFSKNNIEDLDFKVDIKIESGNFEYVYDEYLKYIQRNRLKKLC